MRATSLPFTYLGRDPKHHQKIKEKKREPFQTQKINTAKTGQVLKGLFEVNGLKALFVWVTSIPAKGFKLSAEKFVLERLVLLSNIDHISVLVREEGTLEAIDIFINNQQYNFDISVNHLFCYSKSKPFKNFDERKYFIC